MLYGCLNITERVVPASYRVAYSRTYNTVARLGPCGRRRRRCAEPRESPPCLHDDTNLCGDDGGLGTHKWPISRSGWKLGVARPMILALAPLNGSARRGSITCTHTMEVSFSFLLCCCWWWCHHSFRRGGLLISQLTTVPHLQPRLEYFQFNDRWRVWLKSHHRASPSGRAG
jgi:hypothetical protein